MVTTGSGTVALAPDQREAAIEAGAARAKADFLQNGAADRRPHGQIGIEMDSRGGRAVHGTVVAPIGQNGVAALSYATGQSPRWPARHRYHGSPVGADDSDWRASAAETVNPD